MFIATTETQKRHLVNCRKSAVDILALDGITDESKIESVALILLHGFELMETLGPRLAARVLLANAKACELFACLGKAHD